MMQSMSSSPYSEMFQARISKWENKLCLTQEVLENWQLCQSKWLYLDPIFSCNHIKKQIPLESKRYQDMEHIWSTIMNSAKTNPKLIQLCPDFRLLDSLRKCGTLLEQIEKGLNEYLETKRCAFPRFYFLSNDNLLEILSHAKDPTSIQPFFAKIFENIARVTFEEDLRISEMWSKEGAMIPFYEPLYPKGGVEVWMQEVERVMRLSVKDSLKRALKSYSTTPRSEWVISWPGQVVIAASQTYWTTEVAHAIKTGSLDKYCEQLHAQLGDLIQLVRGEPTPLQRIIITTLIVIDVHAKNIVEKLMKEGV
eukprot:TRINITY_DN2684_c0_g1_i2.p1 TRINITY_DN2684_c0_g1~~TRINITY_DN2684_c0_g1_i2.p1  ORF type:complete len:309 (+),score=72.59 TRINITY_DN2684_c0_g1_i2:316-1242(+)